MATKSKRTKSSKVPQWLKDARKQIAREKQRIKESQKRLRQLERELAKAQKLGLYTPKKDFRFGITKYGKGVASELRDLLQGKATASKINRTDARLFKQQGIKVKNNTVIIPKTENEVYYARKGKLYAREKIGDKFQTREIKPAKGMNIAEYLEQIFNDPKWRGMRAKGQLVTFKFFGHHTRRSFRSINEAIQFFRQYESVVKSEDEEDGDAESQQDIIENIEFVKTTPQRMVSVRERIDERARKRKFRNQRKTAKAFGGLVYKNFIERQRAYDRARAQSPAYKKKKADARRLARAKAKRTKGGK